MNRLEYRLIKDHKWENLRLLTNPETVVVTPFNDGYEVVTTDPATNIKATRATLNGTLVTGASPPSSSCWFQYGETIDYGTTTDSQDIEDGASFSAQVTGLTSNTLYHFRAGTGCFPIGTLVHSPKRAIPIENLKEGDIVWSWNLLTRQLEPKPVTKVARDFGIQFHKIETEDGILLATSSQPFMVVGKGWGKASALEVSDYLMNTDGELIKIVSFDILIDKMPVFNLAVKDNENYFVGNSGVLVHNKTAYGEDRTFRTRAAALGNINIDQLIYQHAERVERFR